MVKQYESENKTTTILIPIVIKGTLQQLKDIIDKVNEIN